MWFAGSGFQEVTFKRRLTRRRFMGLTRGDLQIRLTRGNLQGVIYNRWLTDSTYSICKRA